MCLFCFSAGSWEKRSSPRSWSWSNSRGSTGCVREPASGKSAVAGGKVRTWTWTCRQQRIITRQTTAVSNSSASPLSPHCLFVSYPSSLPPCSLPPYSLNVMKTPQEIWYHRRSLKFRTAVEPLSWWLTQILLALSTFEAAHIAACHISHPNTCKNPVFMSLCLEMCKHPLAPACTDIWHAKKYKETKSRVNTHTCTLVKVDSSFEKRNERRTKEQTAVTPRLCSMEGKW